MTEYEYWLWLCHIQNMWHGKIEKLLTIFDSPREIYYASSTRLEKTGILNIKSVNQIIEAAKTTDVDRIQAKMEKKKIHFTHFGREDFPKRLLLIPDKPFVLFYKGQLPSDNIPSVGMVGARGCTQYGHQAAMKLSGEIASLGINVISGMARGVDSASHLGCMSKEGKTYAVLGCGVDVCYPAQNIELYETILEKGGIISEYIPESKPLAWQFPERNRIISGLSDTVVMVEAREKSGSFITIDYALDQGKNVYAVPGRITDPLSVGSNRLITEGATPLVSGIQMALEFNINVENKHPEKTFSLEKEFELLYSCLCLVPKGIDELVGKTGMKPEEVYEKLLKMQLEGLAIEVTKGQYVKNINC